MSPLNKATNLTARLSLVRNWLPSTKKQMNKKVLLRERKRHTDRSVSGLMGGYPRRGTPLLAGVPPGPGLMGGTQGGVPPGQV